VRLDMPGPIRSLNVSNAAAVSLYAANAFLNRK
jgi:23S rRNA (guanosine2251-2'-O)-methyltransferase